MKTAMSAWLALSASSMASRCSCSQSKPSRAYAVRSSSTRTAAKRVSESEWLRCASSHSSPSAMGVASSAAFSALAVGVVLFSSEQGVANRTEEEDGEGYAVRR